MRYAVRLTLSFILVSILAVAGASGQGITLTFKGGVNGATADLGSDDEDKFLRAGIIAGAALSVAVNDVFQVQPELLFSQKGVGVEDFDADLTLETDYIEVPILLKLRSPGPAAVAVFGGPAVSFETTCSLLADDGTTSLEVDCDSAAGLVDGGLERKKTDFGLVGGAGFEFTGGMVIFSIEGRVTYGLVNLADTGDPADVFKHRVFSVLAGVGFALP